MKNQETPLFGKTYDLLVYLIPASDKFPRSQRYVLGRRLQEVGLGFLDLLLAARKCSPAERGDLLRRADLELDRLRYTVRLCHDIGLLSQKQYRHAADNTTNHRPSESPQKATAHGVPDRRTEPPHQTILGYHQSQRNQSEPLVNHHHQKRIHVERRRQRAVIPAAADANPMPCESQDRRKAAPYAGIR